MNIFYHPKNTDQRYRQAMKQAYEIFRHRHPAWTAAYFDAHFLNQQFRLVDGKRGKREANASALAQAWSRQFSWRNEQKRSRLIAELMPIADEYIRLAEQALHSVDDSRGKKVPS